MLDGLPERIFCHGNLMGTKLRSMGNRISAFPGIVRMGGLGCAHDLKQGETSMSRHGSGHLFERAYREWSAKVLAEKHDSARFPGKIGDPSKTTTRHNAFAEMLRQGVRNVSENSFPVVSEEAEVRFRITFS